MFRALKEKKLNKKGLVNATLAGLSFAMMGISWLFYQIIPILLLLSIPFIFLFFFDATFKEKGSASDKLKAFIVYSTIPVFIFAFAVYPFYGFRWALSIYGYFSGIMPFNLSNTFAVAIGFGMLVLLLSMLIFFLKDSISLAIKTSDLLRIISLFILLLAIFVVFYILQDPNGMFTKRFVPQDVFRSMIGEESPGRSTFPYKYSIYNIVPFLAFPLILLYIAFNKKSYLAPFAFWWLAVALVMAWFKLKFTYALGLPMALGFGAFVGSIAFILSKFEFSSLARKLAAIFIAFIMLSGIAGSAFFVTQREPSIETDRIVWKKAILWIRDNTPENAKLMNTWSYGHWITFISKRKVFADNGNRNWRISSGEFARFLIALDTNSALKIIKKYRPDYIILSSNMFAGFPTLYVYAYEKRHSAILSDPQLGKIARTAFGAYIPCRQDINGVFCAGQYFGDDALARIPTKWQEKAVDVDPQANLPVWVYRDVNDIGIAYLYNSANKSMLAKLWFNADEISKYFTLVHVETSQNEVIKIFKVNNEAIK